MSSSPSRRQHHLQYLEQARAYLDDPSEQQLYEVSMLSRDLMRAGLSPVHFAALHAGVVDDILAERNSNEQRDITGNLTAMLLEGMMVYAETHQEVQIVLRELEKRYAELDETKRALECSRNELRDKTAQLVHAGKMQALGELAAGVVHEINQPLNAIRLICEDLHRGLGKQETDLEDLAESIADVIAETKRMAEITDELRRFGRKSDEKKVQRMDLNQPVRGVLRLVGQQIQALGISLEQELQPGLTVLADAGRLKQVVMNLVFNARDAVSESNSEKKIWVRTYAEGSWAACEIGDTGSGVSEASLEKIFEPFYTSKAPGAGTGLGLSLSRQIVEEHQGHMEVESEQGKGARFRFFLPSIT